MDEEVLYDDDPLMALDTRPASLPGISADLLARIRRGALLRDIQLLGEALARARPLPPRRRSRYHRG